MQNLNAIFNNVTVTAHTKAHTSAFYCIQQAKAQNIANASGGFKKERSGHPLMLRNIGNGPAFNIQISNFADVRFLRSHLQLHERQKLVLECHHALVQSINQHAFCFQIAMASFGWH